MAVSPEDIRIPAELLPADGRFGAGPSKVRKEQVDALASVWQSYLGTSHRQKTVKSQVGRLRAGLSDLFSLPEGYEVVLGNGGSTAFWDVAAFGLVRDRAQFLSFGEFGAKFASGVKKAPHLGDPTILKADPGSAPAFSAEAGVDAYCSPHNETSTGVALTPRRVAGADADALVIIDATSAAGGLAVDADRVRHVLLRAAEELRLRRRPVVRPHVPRRHRSGPRRSRSPDAGSPTSSTCRRRSTTPGWTRPTTRLRSPPS